jgi:hypothetical protein
MELSQWSRVSGSEDFRPISLIHSFIKIITKTLALRLAPHTNNLPNTLSSKKGVYTTIFYQSAIWPDVSIATKSQHSS